MIAYYEYVFTYLLLYFVLSISGNENKTLNELSVNIEYGENATFILSYNLTTNYSYYLTFRLFEHEQIKLGLFLPTYQYEKYSIEVSNRYDSTTELFYLFIICFHFIRQLNDIDIQCKDIRLLKTDQILSLDEYRPTYKPLFVPMMYALSILMLLPVIIQHRRHKQALLMKRRKELRRLSIKITQNNPTILSQIVENRNLNLKEISTEIELVSLPSTKTILDDNDNVSFSLQKLQPFLVTYDEESGITADYCIAHLLDNTPWYSSTIEEAPIISLGKRDSAQVGKEQDDNNDRQPILKSNADCTVKLFGSNPAFIESDV